MLRLLREIIGLIFLVLRYIHPSVSKRLNFESHNLKDINPDWKTKSEKADYCFHVSSEGELEQVMPLVDLFIKQFKRIELIFTSPSVEHRVLHLQAKNPQFIAILRMPLVSYCFFAPKQLNVFKWVSASTIFFCRYDFYPEMMLLKSEQRRFVLLNATSKNLKIDSFSIKWNYYRFCYSLMDVICASLPQDISFFKHFFPKASHFEIELRVLQIHQRLENANQTLQNKMSNFNLLSQWILSVDKNQRYIFGSFWNEESFLVEELILATSFNHSRVLIAPHDLSQNNLQLIKASLEAKLPSQSKQLLIVDGTTREIPPDCKIIILNMKGVLLELYPFFGHAVVGGGFGVSIHSVLEPFLAKSKVVCGPKIHRSTEYDLIKYVTNQKFPKIIEYPGEFIEYIRMIDGAQGIEMELNHKVNMLLDLQNQQMLKFKERIHC